MLTVRSAHCDLPEVRYVFQDILGEMLGIEFRLAIDPAVQDYHLQLPNGNELLLANRYWMQPPASAPEGVVPHPMLPGENIVCLFGKGTFSVDDHRIECGLDIVASVFFMLSRIEEYQSGITDKHGRFPAERSIAYQHGFLDRPVVNEWVDLLWQLLLKLGWNRPRPERSYRLKFSCDVDHPRLWWSATDRFKTVGGALFKRKSPAEAAYFLLHPRDPYDVFDEWFDLFERLGIQAAFNFMGARERGSDCWYPLDDAYVKHLIRKVAEKGHEIGFHPGYESFGDPEAFQRELASLQKVSPVEIRGGRQHYLRFSNPETWQTWTAAGLLYDSTLGYPEAEGFRCGICHDFPVFNLSTRTTLSLRELPLIAMDVTLAGYRRYSPQQALDNLQQLRHQVRKHGGDFTLLWHNSSWNTPSWKPWKNVMLDLIST